MLRLFERLTRRRLARGTEPEEPPPEPATPRCSRCGRTYQGATPGHASLCWWCSTMVVPAADPCLDLGGGD